MKPVVSTAMSSNPAWLGFCDGQAGVRGTQSLRPLCPAPKTLSPWRSHPNPFSSSLDARLVGLAQHPLAPCFRAPSREGRRESQGPALES